MEPRRWPVTTVNVPPSSAMASPTPSTGTVKMNGSLLHQPPPAGQQRATVITSGNGGSARFGHVSTSRSAFDLSSRDPFVHSLHDTSQELSRSMLSGGPRLRTPNPVPTPVLAMGPSFNPSVSSSASPMPGGTAAVSAATPLVLPDGGGDDDARHGDRRSPPAVYLQETLASLALLCVVSLLLAFLAVLFLMKVMPLSSVDGVAASGLCNVTVALASRIVDAGEYRLVYEVVVGLATCTISLDFTCLLICCAQFIFASKLAKTPCGRERAIHYLGESSYSRVLAVGSFFVSIPVLLTAIILYAFIQFESRAAIITSLLLGLSIIVCGLSMIHNVYVWQREKTRASVARIRLGQELKVRAAAYNSDQSSNQGLDLTQNASMELSTLV